MSRYFFFITTMFVSPSLWAGDVVVMLIDMQRGFVGNQVNTPQISELIEHQLELLRWAKSNDKSVFVVEYRPSHNPKKFGATLSILRQELKSFPKGHVHFIYKSTDSLFEAEDSRREVLQKTQELGVDQLIVTGINATACVRATIKDAIDYGFKVFSASDLMAVVHSVRLSTASNRRGNLYQWVRYPSRPWVHDGEDLDEDPRLSFHHDRQSMLACQNLLLRPAGRVRKKES